MIYHTIEEASILNSHFCVTVLNILSSKTAAIAYVIVVFVVLGVLIAKLILNNANVGGTSPVKTCNVAKEAEARAEEDRAPRFCMLCRIDENKAR